MEVALEKLEELFSPLNTQPLDQVIGKDMSSKSITDDAEMNS
jgi:hypothetical protein